MARYSRRRGPSPAYLLTNVTTVIPGVTLTRAFDDGELLILWRGFVVNSSLSDDVVTLGPQLDGANIANVFTQVPIGPSLGKSITGFSLQLIGAGAHTVALGGRSVSATSTEVQADSCELLVIQLPLWDSAADVT